MMCLSVRAGNWEPVPAVQQEAVQRPVRPDSRYVEIDGVIHEVSGDIVANWPEDDWPRLMRCRLLFDAAVLDTSSPGMSWKSLPRNENRLHPSLACGAENWKARCEKFRRITPTFSPPFSGSEIAKVDSPDEVAYCRCRLRSDILKEKPEIGIYVEVEVSANADNLSLAVVDFENGGRSSVTFSPETGAVLRERKVRESPRAIEGTYIHLLPPAPPGRKFEGAMGLYLQGGQLAFFRRWRVALDNASHMAATPNADMQWETTGFCTDLKWAQGPRLSLCLAFRDSGAYRALITQVNNTPPIQPSLSADAYKESKWSLLYGDDDHPLAI
eukprot:s2214_g5.t1